MSSSQAAQARAEAQVFLDRFLASPGGVNGDDDLDAALARLSPEASMIAYESILDATPPGVLTATQKTLQAVGHLMRGGRATLGELRDDLEAMSAEGRARALEILTAHPDYRVRGLRWRPNDLRSGASFIDGASGAAAPGSLLHVLGSMNASSPVVPGVAEPREYTAYQHLIDSVRSLVDVRREAAVAQVFASMPRAGAGDWRGAASVVQEALRTLEDLAANVSPLYKVDVAVALFHLEAFLGNSRDNRGAEAAIRRSIALFRECDAARPGNFTFDVALSSMSLSICLASQGNFTESVRVGSEAIRKIDDLAATDMRAYGPSLAEQLTNLGFFQLQDGNVPAAGRNLDRAVAINESLLAAGVPIAAQFVGLARDRQRTVNAQRDVRPQAAAPRSTAVSPPKPVSPSKPASQAKAQQSNGGCYIATAVYGSYDAPQVRTLRRFRDESLATSAPGRAFVRLYYAVSPSLARRFEPGSVPSRLGRRTLDALVRALDERSAVKE